MASVEEIKHFDDNSAAYDFIDVQSMPITEDTLKSLDEQIQSVDDMNDFLYKIGCCFVGNKSQLAQWIRGI